MPAKAPKIKLASNNHLSVYGNFYFVDKLKEVDCVKQRYDFFIIKEQIMSRIFISYSRKDISLADKIVQALADNNIDTWLDWKSIPKGEDWEAEIYRGIEESDAFLFLVSPDSISSKWCNAEIAQAVKNNKRILPIIIREVDSNLLHPEISKRNWIFCRDGQDNFEKAIEEIRTTIHTDYEWIKFHTQLQLSALLWERNKDSSRLLRGKELTQAEQRLASIEAFKDPQPTSLQRIYILESRRLSDKQRQRTFFIPLVMNLLLIFFMGGYIIYLSRQISQLRSAPPIVIIQTEQYTHTIVLSPTVLPTITAIPIPSPTLTLTPSQISTATGIPQKISQPNVLEEIIQENRNSVIISVVVTIGGFLTAFVVFFLDTRQFGLIDKHKVAT